MGVYRNWVSLVQRKFSKSQTRRGKIIVNQINSSKNLGDNEENDCEELIAAVAEEDVSDSVSLASVKKEYSAEDIAAIKIQAFYRGYLARRAFRALRSLVKLQALVRGVQVRRQSRMALHCMHALVRLQLSVRMRQLLSNATNN